MVINGQTFFVMMVSAANALDNSKTHINNMNIFPVPDGDTGINMTLTMSTIKSLSKFDGTLSDCAEKASHMCLRAARGNSGAILSLFFRGMSKSFKGLQTADSYEVAAALKRGTDEAYKAVMKPTEGTILTVMRACSDKAERVKDKYRGDMIGLFKSILKASEEALANTPNQLPVLKEVNLVDAGGYGFVVILTGMLAGLKGQPVVAKEPTTQQTSSGNVFNEFNTEDITFTYCTECIVEKSDSFKGEGTATEFNKFVCEIGDSVVFIDDDDIIKLHVHTNNPGLVMEKALEYGALATVKVENMRKQHTEIIDDAPVVVTPAEISVPISKKFGFVTVCMGAGISGVFSDLGADRIIFGGQTMNPSTQDVIDAVNLTPSEYVFVLPNNKNSYMVAEQAAKLITDKKVLVLPTKSVPQGVSAMLSFDESASPEDNMEIMTEAIGAVTSISVTQAVRDTTIDGEKIENGQFIGLMNGSIVCAKNSPEECIEALSDNAADKSFITVFYGEGVSAEEAEAACACIKEKVGRYAEMNILDGGQPLYPYIISIE
ncbi:MAG: DAK2 domain-containing protein [Clostridia bacterium]|nr:DAK2 domain-containing protein [Clostridia bacterium]